MRQKDCISAGSVAVPLPPLTSQLLGQGVIGGAYLHTCWSLSLGLLILIFYLFNAGDLISLLCSCVCLIHEHGSF